MNTQSCHRIIPVQWSLSGKITHELFSTLSRGGSFSTLSHFGLPLFVVMDCARRKLVSVTMREACFKLNAEMVNICQDSHVFFFCLFFCFRLFNFYLVCFSFLVHSLTCVFIHRLFFFFFKWKLQNASP